MAKGDAAHDAAVAGKAAANIAAVASVISMDQFPAGSEYQASTDSFALPELCASRDDFPTRVADPNTAAVQVASATDGEGIKAAMARSGAACAACDKADRQPEEQGRVPARRKTA